MARDTGAASPRKAAEKAATELLKTRAALVGDAAVALEDRNRAHELYETAAANYSAAYTAALNGGWEPAELDKLGLETPPTRATNSAGRRRPTTVAATPIE